MTAVPRSSRRKQARTQTASHLLPENVAQIALNPVIEDAAEELVPLVIQELVDGELQDRRSEMKPAA